MNSASIVSKVWRFCTTLRDDGVGYGNYLEQLTHLIFLKMADEYARPPYGRDVGIPKGYAWPSLTTVAARSLKRTTLPQRANLCEWPTSTLTVWNSMRSWRWGITENELRKTRLSAGDPLFVEGNGSIEQIGRVAIWDHKVLIA